jgi:hypothetical protein
MGHLELRLIYTSRLIGRLDALHMKQRLLHPSVPKAKWFSSFSLPFCPCAMSSTSSGHPDGDMVSAYIQRWHSKGARFRLPTSVLSCQKTETAILKREA